MSLEIAISPCPNDTYIFYELSRRGFRGEPVALAFADVEELNRRAIEEQRHPVTKLSCFAMHAAEGSYRLLSSGGALGRGCGPLLLAGKRASVAELRDEPGRLRRILVPGRWTTAAFLTRMFLAAHGFDRDTIELVPTRYDLIMPQLAAGREELGVIIHEERFTYRKLSLEMVADLGDFWESETGSPIPLGCIAVRRDLDPDFDRELEKAIAESIRGISLEDRDAMAFIRSHSQSLEDEVIRAHIDLYVNDYSVEMKAEGHAALRELFRRADDLAAAGG